MDMENFREALRLYVNVGMERSELKEFADYVLQREPVVHEYLRQCYQDLYQNFHEDRENGDA
jgi:hypothetical protein